MVEGGGFEPPKSFDDRFTVCSLWPLGNPSRRRRQPCCLWSWRQDLNPQPADYKSAALPVELRQREKLLCTLSRAESSFFRKNKNQICNPLSRTCQAKIYLSSTGVSMDSAQALRELERQQILGAKRIDKKTCRPGRVLLAVTEDLSLCALG